MTPAPTPHRAVEGVELPGVTALWVVFSPKGVPQPQTCRLTHDDAMQACFGRREQSRHPRDWWQHNLDEGWTCREIAIAPRPADGVAGLVEIERLIDDVVETYDIAGQCLARYGYGSEAQKNSYKPAARAEGALRAAFSDLTATVARQACELRDARAEIERLRDLIKSAEWRGENRAYADVFQAARRVYAHPDNDFSDARAVMTFAERYQVRAVLNDAPPRLTADRPEGCVEGGGK